MYQSFSLGFSELVKFVEGTGFWKLDFKWTEISGRWKTSCKKYHVNDATFFRDCVMPDFKYGPTFRVKYLIIKPIKEEITWKLMKTPILNL